MGKPREVTVTVRLHNNGADHLAVLVEPWCEQYSLPPAASFDLVAKGPERALLEIDSRPTEMTIYGWTGSVVRVFKDGKELLHEAPIGPSNKDVLDPQT